MRILYIYPGDLTKKKASVYQSLQQIKSFDRYCDVSCVSFKAAPGEIDLDCSVFSNTRAFFLNAWSLSSKRDIIYSRSPLMLLPFIFSYKKLVLELHSNPDDHNIAYRVAFRLLRVFNKPTILTITESLANDMHGVNVRLVVPDSAPLVKGVKGYTQKSKLVIGYIGGHSKGKGLDTVQALSHILDYNTFDLVVAGLSRDLAVQLGYCFHEKVDFLGYVERSELNSVMSRIDIGLVPNKAQVYGSGDDFVNIGKYTSPMKLFEYMAYRKLIVASDLDVLKEVLSDDSAFFFHSGDENSLYKVLNYISNNRNDSFLREHEAYRQFSEKYSQDVRTRNILKILC